MSLAFTFVDLLVVLVMLVSAGLCGLARFRVAKRLSIFAWAAAAFATLYFGPWLVAADARHDRHAAGWRPLVGLCRRLPGGVHSAVLHQPSLRRKRETFARRAARPRAGRRLRRGARAW